MSRRVYVPLGWADLTALAKGEDVASRAAFAVTERQPRDERTDDEELEFDALCDALDAADALRAASGDRRLVVAADAGAEDRADAAPSAVSLSDPLRRADVVSVHVEEHPGQGIGEGYDDLLWYDVTEIQDLLRETP